MLKSNKLTKSCNPYILTNEHINNYIDTLTDLEIEQMLEEMVNFGRLQIP